jgi:hypothetical protein
LTIELELYRFRIITSRAIKNIQTIVVFPPNKEALGTEQPILSDFREKAPHLCALCVFVVPIYRMNRELESPDFLKQG